MGIKRGQTRELVLSGFFVALGLIIPFLSAHAFGIPGTVLLPMHFPVLLCGLLCGPKYGVWCGLITPVVSGLLTGMPGVYPMLPIMVCELILYGAISGLVYQKMHWPMYPSLLLSMLCGRCAYGLMYAALTLYGGQQLKVLSVWGAFLTGLPGIALQLLFIPFAVLFIRRYLFQEAGQDSAQEKRAKEMIQQGKASCVILRGGRIVWQGTGKGVRCLMELYENHPENLDGADVLDKIIGKAAAMIIVLGKAKSVYGKVMSVAAKEYLQKNGIRCSYGVCVDVIRNRSGNGICPIERSVLEVDDPAKGLEVLKHTLRAMKAG